MLGAVLVETQHHFAVTIHSATLPDFPAWRAELRDELLARARSASADPRTSRNAWHSPVHLEEDRTPVVVRAVTALRAFIAGALGDRDATPRIYECWAVVGGRGAWHVPHNHFPGAFSGVLYVDAEHVVAARGEGKGREREGALEFLNPIGLAAAFGLPSGVAYPPRDGLALLFPAALTHLVHPNPSDTPRVVLSFNVTLDPRPVQPAPSRAVPENP